MNQKELKELLEYSPKTGLMRWISARGGCGKGAPAGCTTYYGYIQVRISGRSYAAHRLAWLYMTGSFPKDEIDHINGDRGDNRWINLRQVSKAENRKNAAIPRRSTSGVIGVNWDKHAGKWLARITVDKHVIYLGGFLDMESARVARKLGEEKYGFHPNHGRENTNPKRRLPINEPEMTA